MDHTYCLQRFLHHPQDGCEPKGLMPSRSWRLLSPVRLNLLLKAQTVPRQTVCACLQAVACGALSSSLSLPLAFRPPPNALKFASRTTLYSCHNTYMGETQDLLPALPQARHETVACWYKTIFCYTHKFQGVSRQY